MQGFIQSGNYGFQIPNELLDSQWKKCLEDQNQNQQLIKTGLANIRCFLSQQVEPNGMLEIVFQSETHKSIVKYCKRVFRRLNYNNAKCEEDLANFHQMLWIFTNLASGDSKFTNELISLGLTQLSKQIFTLPELPGIQKIFSINFQLISNIAGQFSLKIKMSYLSDSSFQQFFMARYQFYINCGNFHEYAAMALYNMFRDFSKCTDKQAVLMQIFAQNANFYLPLISNYLLKVQPQSGNIEALFHLLLIFFQLTKDQSTYNNQIKNAVQIFLNHPMEKIRNLCIKIYGNMVANSDQGVDFALQNCLFINLLIHSLKNSNEAKLQKQSAWILSNMLAGTPNQIDYFIQYNPTIFNDIYQVLNQNLSSDVIKQMNWSISNLYFTCSQKAFQTVYQSSIVQQISNLVFKSNLQVVKQVYVEGIQKYLNKLISNSNLKLNIFAQNSTSIISCLNQIIQTVKSQKTAVKAQNFISQIFSLLQQCQNGNIIIHQNIDQNLSNMHL